MGSRAALFPTELAFRGNEIPNSVSHAIVRLQSERHTAQVGSAQQQRAGTSALSHAALGTQRARNGGGGEGDKDFLNRGTKAGWGDTQAPARLE